MTITNKEQCIKTLEELFKSWVIPELKYQIEYCKMSETHPENFAAVERHSDKQTMYERQNELKDVSDVLAYLKDNLK